MKSGATGSSSSQSRSISTTHLDGFPQRPPMFIPGAISLSISSAERRASFHPSPPAGFFDRGLIGTMRTPRLSHIFASFANDLLLNLVRLRSVMAIGSPSGTLPVEGGFSFGPSTYLSQEPGSSLGSLFASPTDLTRFDRVLHALRCIDRDEDRPAVTTHLDT